jgi:hypothetical protein
VEQRIAEFLRAAGETRAADLVDRGAWDAPANGAGKPAAEQPAPS